MSANQTATQSPPAPPRRRRRRLLRILLTSVIMVALLASLGFWIITRSWFIIWQITPELERKLGGRVTIAAAAYQGNGCILFSDLKLQARGLHGPAGEVASIARAAIKIDLSHLLSQGIRISDIEVDDALLRISEDVTQSGAMNFQSLQPDWSRRSAKPMPPPPRVRIRKAALELGSHDQASYQVLSRRLLSGEMNPAPGSGEWYDFVLAEVDEQGAVITDGLFMNGKWNAATNECRSQIGGMELDDRIYRMCPSRARLWWDLAQLKGRVSGVEFNWQPGQPFSIVLGVRNIALTLPIETGIPWARYREGQIETSSSRPRMHVNSGVIQLGNDSLRLVDMTGELGSSDERADLVNVPYNLNFAIHSLPQVDWSNRVHWMEQVLKTAPFELKLAMKEFSSKRDEGGAQVAVELPALVARALAKFQVTGWVLSTSVEVTRGAPTLDDNGRLVAAKTVADGQALIDKASGSYQKFPYQLDDVHAYLQFDNDKVTVHYLNGKGSGNAELKISGEIAPPDNDAAVSLRIVGTNVPLDDRFRAALKENELEAFNLISSRSARDSLAAVGLLPDDAAITAARTQQQEIQQQLNQLRQGPDAADVQLARQIEQLQGRVDRLERFINAGAFQLGGTVNVDLMVERPAGPRQPTSTTGTITVQRSHALYERFPYPLRVTGGTLDWQKDRVVIMPGPEGRGLAFVAPGGGRGSINGELLLPRSGGARKIQPNLTVKVEDDEFNPAVYAAIPLPKSERAELGPDAKWPGGTLSRAARLVRGLGLTGPAGYSGTIDTDADGRINYNFDLNLQSNQARPTHELAQAIGAAEEFWPEDFQLDEINGTVHIGRDAVRWNDISGHDGEATLSASGLVNLAGDAADAAISIDMQNLAMDPRILNAVPPAQAQRVHALWDQTQPQGTINVGVEYQRTANADKPLVVRLQPVRVSAALGDQRLTVRGAGGQLLLQNGTVNLDKLGLALFRPDGQADGTLVLEGTLAPSEVEAGYDVRGAWTGGRLESPLIAHLLSRFASPQLVQRYQDSQPIGVFDADMHVQSSQGQGEPGYEFVIRPKSINMMWNATMIAAEIEQGQVTLTPGRIAIADLRGRNAGGEFQCSGQITTVVPVEARLRLGYRGPIGAPLVQALLPPTAAGALKAVKFEDAGPTTLSDCELHITQIDQSPQAARWRTAFKGRVKTSAAAFEAGVKFSEVAGTFDIDLLHAPGVPLHLDIVANADWVRALGQGLTNVQAPITLADDGGGSRELRMPLFRANAGEGLICAQATCGILGHGDYRATIEMAGVPLDGFTLLGSSEAPPATRPERERSSAQGEVYASAEVVGRRDDPSSRRGRGVVRVLRGRIANIPLAMQVMQVIQLTAPFSGGLDYADADMVLFGDRVLFERILFESSLGKNAMLQLMGEGWMNFDSLELATRFRSRSGVAIVRDIVGGISDRLYEIEVTGPLGNPKARVVALPAGN